MISLLFLFFIVSDCVTTAFAMRMATWNLRFDSKPDNITVQQSIDALPDPLVEFPFQGVHGEQPWSTRRLRVAQTLLSEDIDIAGFQEALVRQVRDLAELLGDDWSWVGVGRDDGKEAGEFSPIFFKKSKFTLVSNDSFWLSDTPFEPSRFPGAGSIRICTATRFTVKEPSSSGPQHFAYLNAHLDDASDQQRQLGTSLILTRARFEAFVNGGPVLVTGDFNSPSTGSDSGGYKVITGAQPPLPINATFAKKFDAGGVGADFRMIDFRGQAPRQSVSKNYATFTGFTEPNDTSDWTRIDFAFGGSTRGWNATGYKVLSALQDDGTLSSDHRPVFADVSLE
ncbi:hypothetical protein E1B28_005045 [Marasmius oreades]|uniref:Endonuclease/exonuclease/phosphatase domain-containing protein n=1 Tax=Marasmius oreades TaxID=181124 RepID=A0A9P8ADL2_9AGAR|nr:uncharacterized protein E1B28_005045 [Marasmius oreades]KAG7097724.1 hypothetical protein E1B28_005045 [Marasmius oreades]